MGAPKGIEQPWQPFTRRQVDKKEVVMLDELEMGYTLAVHRCPLYQIAKPPLSRRSLQSQRIDSIGAVL